jgi:hypothetical protein
MDRAEKLRGERDSYAVTLSNFILSSNKQPERLFCFFEGEDDKYYCVRIDQAIPNSNYASIPCKGKKNLLHIHDIVTTNREYQNHWIAFFTDRDFDTEEKLIDSPVLYYTPCYSIENLYVSLVVFQKILRTEFKISDTDETTQDNFAALSNLFQNMIDRFLDEIEDFMIWRLIQIQKVKLSENQYSSLDINLDELVLIGIETVEKKYKLDDLFAKCPIEDKEWQEKIEWIRQQREHRWRIFRGKDQIEFLRKLLTKLKEDATSRNPQFFIKKIAVKLSLSKDNIISELSQYAITPDCLHEFLKSIEKNRPSKS